MDADDVLVVGFQEQRVGLESGLAELGEERVDGLDLRILARYASLPMVPSSVVLWRDDSGRRAS
jgi:hypothetical protein